MTFAAIISAVGAVGSAYVNSEASEDAGNVMMAASQTNADSAAADRELQLQISRESAAATQALADANSAAAAAAIAESQRQYDIAREDQMPWLIAGQDALGTITAGLQEGGEFNTDFTLADFVADPGYEFRMAEGLTGIEQSAAARGGVLSGNTLRAITEYGQDYASNEYSNAYTRWNADRDRRYNRFAGVAGTGQTAAQNIAQTGTTTSGQITDTTGNLINSNNNTANTLTTLGGQSMNAISTTGQALAQSTIDEANARAGIYIGQGNAYAGAVGSLANIYGQYSTLNNLYSGMGSSGSGSTYSGTPLSYYG
jgi:hypothetical protein